MRPTTKAQGIKSCRILIVTVQAEDLINRKLFKMSIFLTCMQYIFCYIVKTLVPQWQLIQKEFLKNLDRQSEALLGKNLSWPLSLSRNNWQSPRKVSVGIKTPISTTFENLVVADWQLWNVGRMGVMYTFLYSN